MKVIVIGGGPAGMVAAITAAENGHDVTIIEKMNSIRKETINNREGKMQYYIFFKYGRLYKKCPRKWKVFI